MIQPTPRAIRLAMACFPVALLPALVHPRLWGVWIVAVVWLGMAIGLDALISVPARSLKLEIVPPESLAVGETGRLEVRVRAPRSIAHLEVLCDLHSHFDPVAPGKGAAGPRPLLLEFPLTARRRGRLTVDQVWCRWEGPLRLVRCQLRQAVGATVNVSPNLRPVRAAAFRYFGGREIQSGMQVERFVGDGSEFDTLREYLPGLDPRAIDWKASARHRKLLCQEFRAERNHQVILAMDSGHLMNEPLLGIPRLDHAITSALLLAYVSLRLGDRVGLFGFDAAARAWTEPQGGLGAFPRLRIASAQLAPSTAETNYTLGLAELSSRLRRRSLVVVFTEFVDTVTAELMIENLTRLARRQLVVFVALRDPALDGYALARPRRLTDVYRSVVASDFVRERERVLARLRRLGILCIDAAPGAVSSRLVNQYLEVKRREMV